MALLPSFIGRLTKSGVSFRYSRSENRSIFLSNVIALIIGSLYLLLLIVYSLRFSFDRAGVVVFLSSIIFGCVPLLNKKGFTYTSRYTIVITATVSLLLVTLFRKVDGFTSESAFYVSRAGILILSAMLPVVLFHNRERKSLVICLFISFLVVMLFDPLHNLFGVGYYQVGNTAGSYYFNNFYYFFMFVSMVSIMQYLKKTMEDYEARYEISIQSLSEKNLQIEKQRIQLADKNTLLMEVLSQKDQDLVIVNQELIQKNNDLLQFSFAVSHNVRGPVSSILGLIGLIERKPSRQEMNTLLEYLSQSVTSLDTILQGLNNILDARDDTFNIKEKVDLKTELDRIEEQYDTIIKQNNVNLRYKLDVDNLFTIRPYIQNILSQLIANGIQFRSPERKPEIKVLTARENGSVLIRVEDNGLGLDLERWEEDLFRPFKRFHPTSSGKGIGLYLVKLQVEKLRGSVDVLSEPGRGFKITIRLNDESHRMN